ncbi:amino acid ABC transporter substrate-binding protein, PAAT family (TC 3.A.1.3.-) [Roseomonas rosea]|uniref:Amino acid ABC transporter substrate-binding protein, PAAT family (TC 3.A.1.3.-) n=1 Tax=Muricoccus roseus TaxID=198092 RepID=A0A1M6H4A0_9PROT|nr:transporter substrate-binding domain-containing protein [Roseomonas rosea]SHJ17024.1 amino acid ABC transporter substrate-binding protein, PAAT family (TC 3.A.1.3.-) [Roseomonas rosea]
MSITRRGLGAAALGTGLAAAYVRRAAANNLEKAKRAGELVIATEMHFAPFDFTEGGKQVGLNAELFAEFGKEIGVKITFQDLPWPAVLPGLEASRYDLVGGPATITRARAERYRFSVPVAEATVALLKRANDSSITKPQDIAGKQLGGATATAQLAQFQAFVATLPGTTPPIREYQSFSEAYADLAAGRVAAVGNSLPNIAYVAKQRPNVFAVVQPPFGTKSYFGYIGRKDADSAPLMDALDAHIVKMRNDGRLAALQTKWFGQAFETPDTVPAPQV